MCMQTAQLTYSDIDGNWKMLECTATEMLASCETEEDWQMITGRLAPLKTKLAEVKETTEHKAAVHELLAEHLKARTAAEERILNLRQQLKDDTMTVDEMEELRSDLGKARNQLMELESRHPEMETLMTEAGLMLKDREVEDMVDVKADTEKLLSKVEKDDKMLKICAEMAAVDAHLHETDSKLNELNEVYIDDMDSLGPSLQVLSFMFLCVTSTAVSL